MRSANQFLGLSALGFAILGLAAFIAVFAWGMSSSQASDIPVPNLAKAVKGSKNVGSLEAIRRDHGRLLLNQREETLRQGIRGGDYSLKECVACHATKSPNIDGGKVRTIEPFCSQCHTYAAVSIDCFECHTNTAPPGPMTAVLPADHQIKALNSTLKNRKGEPVKEGEAPQ